MRRPGCYPEALSCWHLQVVSLHVKSWTPLSVSFAFAIFLPVSERRGRTYQGVSCDPCFRLYDLLGGVVVDEFRKGGTQYIASSPAD